jgi:hypothetical protein
MEHTMPITKRKTIKCHACDATLSVEATAPRRQIGKVLARLMDDLCDAKGWEKLKLTSCPQHSFAHQTAQASTATV